jgi:SNF2 family DNA or RNA helicase
VKFQDLFSSKYPLKSYQVAAIEFLARTPKALLADDVGLGKTVEAIAHLCSLVATNELALGHDHILWITSANLIDQTAQEFELFAPKFGVLTQTDRLFEPVASVAYKLKFETRYGDGPDILIVSHQQAASSGKALFERFGSPAVVVIDEAMKLKGGGKGHSAICRLTKDVPRVLVMTATPFENDGVETYRILQLLHLPNIWPEADFNRRFILWSEPFRIPGTFSKVPARALGLRPDGLAEFREFLHGFLPGTGVMLRRTAEEVHARVPVRVGDRVRWIRLNADQQAAYNSVPGKGGVAHIKRTQIARQTDGSSALVDALMNALHYEFGNEKVIVYCETLPVLAQVSERLEACGIGYVSVEGKVLPKVRGNLLATFRDDPSTRVLVGSRVLELGLNIQHCRVLISLDSSDNPQRESQREGRIRRIGSPHETYVHITLLPDTSTSVRRAESLDEKRRGAAQLLDVQGIETAGEACTTRPTNKTPLAPVRGPYTASRTSQGTSDVPAVIAYGRPLCGRSQSGRPIGVRSLSCTRP